MFEVHTPALAGCKYTPAYGSEYYIELQISRDIGLD